MASTKEGPDWPNLPKNIVDLVAEKLTPPLSQLVWFGAVCKPWHATIMENRELRHKVLKGCYQLPLLMIPTKSEERRGLYNIIEKKRYSLELSVPNKRRCCGSSLGWLPVADFAGSKFIAIKLINPFTGDVIDLPSIKLKRRIVRDIETFAYEYEIHKVILSDDPYLNPDNYMVAALVGTWGSIAIIRPGTDKSWTYTKFNYPDSERAVKCDAIFLKDQIYAVDWRHGIISIDVSSTKAMNLDFEEIMFISPKGQHVRLGYVKTYIVESLSTGNLLTVERDCDTSLEGEVDNRTVYCYTKAVKVYELSREECETKLVEIKSLGDEALFLGDNHSMSVVASQYPECQSNCIYFTNNNTDFGRACAGQYNMGIFNLENGCFERLYDPDPTLKDMPPPLWILPTLQGNWD